MSPLGKPGCSVCWQETLTLDPACIALHSPASYTEEQGRRRGILDIGGQSPKPEAGGCSTAVPRTVCREGGEQRDYVWQLTAGGEKAATGPGAHYAGTLSRAPSFGQSSACFSGSSLSLGLLCTPTPHPTIGVSRVTHSLEPYVGPSQTFPRGGSHKLPGMGSVSPPPGLLQGAVRAGRGISGLLASGMPHVPKRRVGLVFPRCPPSPQLPEHVDLGLDTVPSLEGSLAPYTILT